MPPKKRSSKVRVSCTTASRSGRGAPDPPTSALHSGVAIVADGTAEDSEQTRIFRKRWQLLRHDPEYKREFKQLVQRFDGLGEVLRTLSERSVDVLRTIAQATAVIRRFPATEVGPAIEAFRKKYVLGSAIPHPAVSRPNDAVLRAAFEGRHDPTTWEDLCATSQVPPGGFLVFEPRTITVQPVSEFQTALQLYWIDDKIWIPLDEWDSVKSIRDKVKAARRYSRQRSGYSRRPRINPREKARAQALREAGKKPAEIARLLAVEPSGSDVPNPTRREASQLAETYRAQGLSEAEAQQKAVAELTLGKVQTTDVRRLSARARARVHRRFQS